MHICLHKTANFGQLTAEVDSRVWDTPANFNVFRILAALLHGTLVVGVGQIAALNRGRHLYLAGRPSRWALAHILVMYDQRRTRSLRSRLAPLDVNNVDSSHSQR